MASLAKLVWSSLRRIRTPEDGASTSASAATTSRVSPSNPETGVGLLAAVAEPASSYLRIANQPVPAGTHGIMTVGTDLCCAGPCSSAYCCGTLEMTMRRVDSSCRLCSHRLDDAVAYMYMGMMFCSRRCRFDYFMEALYDQRHMEATGTPVGDQVSAALREALVSAEEKESFRKAFFAS